ncbi:flavin reductase family protein [Actinoplanes auranticolor]|uniref:Oxidoreductase n=1 Tax=Actinoplanes auranticolor TaxID=47988 RepID=A0A919SWW1_9ACTN|nr:flavin reductase family protein [Actinoplanes auranticolor]GIM80161.1 oxidoreductase [Actinoplanes auranticolor]
MAAVGPHAPATTIDATAGAVLRHAARRFATGVTVVAVHDGVDSHALTANSFVTLSLRPPLIGIAVRPDGRMRAAVDHCATFGVSVLSSVQQDYARHFAGWDRSGHPVGLVLSAVGPGRAVPLVPGCVAHFICELRTVHPVGDHDLIVAEVTSCEVSDQARSPLIFLDGVFHDDVPEP